MEKEVLLIEDNGGDIKLIEEAIKDGNLSIKLNIIKDGGDALSYMEDVSKGTIMNWPSIIVMDLNLPKVSGIDLLKKFKADPEFCQIPVIILTTSNLSSDIKMCYQLGANAYINKPLDVFVFFEIIQEIDKFWLQQCTLPHTAT
ncbi:MAG: response regulator [Saprospiraceae bacterium]|nr:response regulator [Saprospiraceae bacterium]